MKKNIIIIISLLLTTLMAQAQTQAQTVTKLVVKCSKETDSLTRLVCYDSVAENIAKNLPATQDVKSPEPIIASAASAASAPASTAEARVTETLTSENQSDARTEAVSQFGMERQIAIEKTDDIIYAQVSSIKKDHYGKLTVELDNGQTWKQSDSNNIRLKVGGRLYIERGALGSFFLSTDDTNRRVRVKRTK